MIQIRDVTKTYRMGDTLVHALRGVSLTIEEGDFVAIMGPSGSGKSTLAQILGLLDVPSAGSYLLNGREVSSLSEDELAVVRREQIGFVFQQFNLLPRMNASENIGLPLLYSKRAGHVPALLDLVGLTPRAHHRPNELSGGQQQRVAIARALVNEPRIIFADEPTGNLDSRSEAEIMNELRALNARGITVLIVTHEDEIGAQANRLIRLRDGVIQSDERRVPLVAKAATPPTPPAPRRAGLGLSDVFAHLVQGYRTLAANKVRTGLSMLGILIGVAAVIAMLALGRGAQAAIEQQLSSLGSNLLILRPGSLRVGGVAQESGTVTRLTTDDAEAVSRRIEGVRHVAATVTGRAQVTYANKNWSTSVQGVSPEYAAMHASSPDRGRFFTADETKSRVRVAAIGATLVRELFGGRNPIGETIKVNKVSFVVVGVLPEKGANGFRDQDDVLMVPLNTAMHRLLGKEYVDTIELEVESADLTESVQASTLNLMYQRHRVAASAEGDAYEVRNLADIQAALSKSSQTMSMLLAAIAAISLLVGGIGIMNIMLVSVTERTKEIGLRKAVGARRVDILLQFLAESVVVSAIGGALGLALGWFITTLISSVLGWATSVTFGSAFLAVFTSGLIGVVFGIYPARRASALHPIEALRYE